jgi:hypothetical protein
MKVIPLKCPECGATIQVEEGRQKCFCTYCGTQLYFDDGNKTITYHEIKEHTERTIDEARIKEAENERLKMELETPQKHREEQFNYIVGGVSFVIIVIMVLKFIFA